MELEKMSKKAKKEYYSKYRNSWDFSPVTRKEPRNKGKLKKEKERARELMS